MSQQVWQNFNLVILCLPLSSGGTGASLSIGSAGQVLKVNTGFCLEFGFVDYSKY